MHFLFVCFGRKLINCRLICVYHVKSVQTCKNALCEYKIENLVTCPSSLYIDIQLLKDLAGFSNNLKVVAHCFLWYHSNFNTAHVA